MANAEIPLDIKMSNVPLEPCTRMVMMMIVFAAIIQ